MKKHLALFALLFLCCIGIAVHAEEAIQAYYTFPKREYYRSICPDEKGGFYLATKRELLYFSGEKNDVGTPIEDVPFLSEMMCDGNTLYALTERHEIFRFENNQWILLGKNEQFNDPAVSPCFCAGDGHLYYSFYEQEDTDRNHLIDYDLTTSTFSEIKEFPVWGFFYNRQTHLICCHDYGEDPDDQFDVLPMVMQCFDPQTKQKLDPIPLPHLNNLSVKMSHYEPVSGAIFYHLMDNRLMRWTENEGLKLVRYEDHSHMVRIILSDGRAVIDSTDDQERTNLYIVGEKESKGVLTVQGYQCAENAEFTKKTGIDIQLGQNTDDMDAIAELMVTQNSEVDLFAIRTENGLNIVKDKGFFVDLSQNAVLNDAFGKMYPAVARPVMTENGMMAAFPVVAQPCFLDMNAEALASASIPLPQTWDDLLDILPQVLDSDLMQEDYVPFDTIACNRLEVLQRFVRDYMLSKQISRRTVDFAQEDFRRIAERILREVPKEDPYPRGDEGTEEALFALDTVPVPIMAGLKLPLRVNAEDSPAVFTSVLALVVNPYSKHQQEAFRYLEFLANLRDPQSYAHIATMTEPTFYPNQQAVLQEAQARLAEEEQRAVSEADAHQHQDEIERLREEVRELEQSCYMVSPKDIAWYQSVAPHLIATDQPLITADQSFQTLVAQLAEGKMSLDQFVEKANANIRMREME